MGIPKTGHLPVTSHIRHRPGCSGLEITRILYYTYFTAFVPASESRRGRPIHNSSTTRQLGDFKDRGAYGVAHDTRGRRHCRRGD